MNCTLKNEVLKNVLISFFVNQLQFLFCILLSSLIWIEMRFIARWRFLNFNHSPGTLSVLDNRTYREAWMLSTSHKTERMVSHCLKLDLIWSTHKHSQTDRQFAIVCCAFDRRLLVNLHKKMSFVSNLINRKIFPLINMY